MSQPENLYISGPEVRARYGISQTTHWRWENDTTIGFPKPLKVGGMRLFKLSELEAWEAAQAAKSAGEAA